MTNQVKPGTEPGLRRPGPASGSNPGSVPGFSRRRVGLIGHGRIGRIVAAAIAAGEAGGNEIVAILTRGRDGPASALFHVAARPFLAVPVDLYLECAGPQALATHGEALLARADVWTVSGAALADAGLRARLEATGRAAGHRLRVLAGAIGGLDALAALATQDIDAATLSIRAPEIEAATVSSLAEAARRMPDGVNVAAAAAAAGGLWDDLRVRLSPADAPGGRSLSLDARGPLGSFEATLRPHTDPGRGLHIVAASLVAALRREDETIQVG